MSGMTTDTKKLVEFATKFLDDEYWRVKEVCDNEDFNDEHNFFVSRYSAPILAHLAKREMEKRGFGGFHYTHPHKNGGYRHHFAFIKDYSISDNSPSKVMRENEYIALWSAIEATGEK